MEEVREGQVVNGQPASVFPLLGMEMFLSVLVPSISSPCYWFHKVQRDRVYLCVNGFLSLTLLCCAECMRQIVNHYRKEIYSEE
jgi:hypothetical protein